MIFFFLIDILIFLTTSMIPCFFLVGFVREKKLSYWTIFTCILFYDGLLSLTNGLFLGIFLILFFIKKSLEKKKINPLIELNFLQIIFFLLILVASQTQLHFFFSWKVGEAFVYNNMLLFLLIKTNPIS